MTYSVHPIKDRQGHEVPIFRCPSPDGWKTRAARLAEALKGRYSHRRGGYTMSRTSLQRFERLYAQRWDASYLDHKLIPPQR